MLGSSGTLLVTGVSEKFLGDKQMQDRDLQGVGVEMMEGKM